jgi:hypothetical protein
MTSKYAMTETARRAVIAYLMAKLDNEVEMMMLESASRSEVLCINTLDFALYVEEMSLDNLSKVMRVTGAGVELRAVKYEASSTPAIKALLRRSQMMPKSRRVTDWEDGEQAIADLLGGERTGGNKGHAADVIVSLKMGGKNLHIEIKHTEGRLY